MNERRNSAYKLLAIWGTTPDNRSLLTSMRKRDRWLRGTAIFVTATFLNLTLQSLAIAANAPDRLASTKAAPPSNEEKLSQTLQTIEDRLDKLETKLKKGEDTKKEKDDLKALRQELTLQDANALKDFDAIERHLKDKKLPQVILNRHHEAVKTYKQEMATVKANLDDLDKAKSDEERQPLATKAKKHLKAKQKRARSPVDPNNLPTRVLKPNRNNKPKVKQEEFHAAGLFDNPYVMLAAHGNYRIDQLPGASDPAYLAATPEVVLSDVIRAKAGELEHHPVKIYQWVRNNIEWVPSWGSVQGAELTLASLKGNSIDTASLLVALLRASGVPARYVHGTIEVPVDRFMNWAGGFTDANSAWDFVSSGGVPLTGVTSGGKVSAFRMQHVWVEAAIDFEPARGAINKSADSWVALDASFKQRDITPGFDVTASVPFDANDYLSQVRSESPVLYYQQKIQNFLEANLPDKSVGNAMGFMLIKPDESSVLPSSLPHRILVSANRYGTLPSGLRHTVQLAFIAPNALEPEVVSLGTAEVAGKRLTLSYLPASSADEATITQYGGDMYVVPPYLLYLKPTLKVDGAIVYQGAPIQMGLEHSLVIGYRGPTISAQSMAHKLVSGGYYAVGLNLQGVNHSVLGAKNHRLIETLTTQTADTATRDDLIGEHLTALMLMWFMSNDRQYQGAAKLYRVASARTLSAGLAGFTLTVRYFFGLPRSASPNRAQFDVGLEAGQVASLDGNAAKRSAYLQVRGLTGSYNEHGIWEAIHGFDAVSAVKGLQAANAQGIPIYTVTQANFNQIFPLLQLAAEDEQEIQQGVQLGLTAIVPQREVRINDWVGAGFILKDPQTHSGVYRISGGLSGGSSTKQADGFQIVSLFKQPFGWLLDRLDLAIRGFITSIAGPTAASGELSCTDFYEIAVTEAANLAETGAQIVEEANKLLGKGYEEIGRCTGLVIQAYGGAGIDLRKLARNVGSPDYVPHLFALAKKIGLPAGVKGSDQPPLAGDIVFFNYTYERKPINCILADEEQPTHVGVVEKVESNGAVRFIHASGRGVTRGIMTHNGPDNGAANSALRKLPEPKGDTYCPSDARKDSNSPGISERSNALFAGYATIRDTGR